MLTHLNKNAGSCLEKSQVLVYAYSELRTLKDTKCVELRALSFGITAWLYGIARKASTPTTLLSSEDSQPHKGIVVCLVTRGFRFDTLLAHYCCQHRKKLLVRVVKSICPCMHTSRSLIPLSQRSPVITKTRYPEVGGGIILTVIQTNSCNCRRVSPEIAKSIWFITANIIFLQTGQVAKFVRAYSNNMNNEALQS